jgi:transketolase
MKTETEPKDQDERAGRLREKAREVRLHILDMIHTAQSGHPGGSLSAADFLTALYFEFLNIRPEEPRWPDRDRLILSKGHACPVLYACLALRGFFPVEHLKTLRRFESILQGHPIIKTPGVDMSTGSLGHGLAVAVGIALDGRLRGKDYRTWAVLGDGELNEGSVWEAAAAAAKYRLERLAAIVDRNGLQNDGFTAEIMPMEPIADKWRAFGWQVLEMDGHDMGEVVRTLEAARGLRGAPVCIVARTVKGKGVSFMENRPNWHGKPPDDAQYRQAVRELAGGAA